MSWDESVILIKVDKNFYEERITLDEKMRTKLTLEQKRWILDLIGNFNRYLKTKAENFYRYVFLGCVHYCDGNTMVFIFSI